MRGTEPTDNTANWGPREEVPRLDRRRFLQLILASSGALSLAALLAACGGIGSPPTAVGGQSGSGPATAGGSGTPSKGGTLTVALPSDIIGIDPHGASAGVDRNIYTTVYNGLVTVDKDLKIVPDLAESWTTPDDKTYVFKLRAGVKFHDGTPCDATAVKKNFDWILDTSNASPRRSEIADIQEVTAEDATTVKIALKNPFAPFLSIISDRAGYIVSPAAREKFGKDYSRNPVGTGPYQFVEWIKDDRVTFKRFDGYWEKDVAYLDQITYRPVPDASVALTDLKTGNVDFLYSVDPKDVADIKKTSNLAYLEGPGVGYQGFWVNMAKGPLATKALREAFSLALDREELLAAAYFGIGQIANGPIPPSSWAYDATLPVVKRDLAQAKAKLAEGGQAGGFKMVLKTSNTPLQQKITQLVQAQLKEIGIEVQIQTLEFGALLKAGEQNDFDALSLGWSGRIDPDGNVEPIFGSKGAFNYGKYSSPEIDTLITRARQTAGQDERKKVYQELARKINDDVAYAFTYFPPTSFAAVTSVKGFEVTPDGLMRFKKTWLSK